MSNRTRNLRRLLALPAAILAAAALSSCGGGDPYTGLWVGTRDGRVPVRAILLSDGTYYMQYVRYAGPHYAVGGVVRGTGEFHGARFTSEDGMDFKFGLAPTPAKVTGKLGGHQTVTGSVDASPLKLTYEKPFDPHGVLADLAGSYPGRVTFALGVRQTTFEVTPEGALSASLNGCSITGQVVPRGDDAFDLTIRLGGSPCRFPGAIFQGAAIYSKDLQELEAAVVSTAYRQAITFVASKGQ